jgi:predicted dehydrogenase
VKFLIAGLGSIGRRHLRNLVALGEEDIVLYRTGKSTLPDDELEPFLTEYTLEDALGHGPDAVIVSNPTAFHLNVAIPAAKQGCHLLIEKPVSHSMDRIGELQAAVSRGGGRVLVGFQFRFHPGLQKVKSWIETGLIGTPVYAQVCWGEYLPGWHPWEDFRNGYAAREDLGGGVLLTLCHPFDYLRWIFGELESITTNLGHAGPWDIGVEDSADSLLRFHSGLNGSVHLDYLQRPAEHSLKVVGTKGMITWANEDGAARHYDAQSDRWKTFRLPSDFERNKLFLDEMTHFLSVIRGHEEPVCDLGDGIAVMEVLISARQSAMSGERSRIAKLHAGGDESP